MARFLFAIIYILFAVIFRGDSSSDSLNMLNNNNSYKRNNLVDFFRLHIRRRKAFKACRNFLKKEKGYYKLRNKNLVLIYDYKHKIIKCYENANKKRITTLDWYKQCSMETFCIDNLFEETFDNICYSFNDKSTYDKVAAAMQYYFKTEQIETQKGTKIEAQKTPYFSDEALDINQATEEEITNLPGINVILAKKIIEYRDLHSGFKTVDELYKEMKIKPHFQKQLNTLICVKEYQIKDANKNENERIIDL